MKLRLDKQFWVVLTLIILVFTVFIVGRNAMHAWQIRGDIRQLEAQKATYRQHIERDSALMEGLRYDDRLEQFARERYRMQRRDEKVYLVKENQ